MFTEVLQQTAAVLFFSNFIYLLLAVLGFSLVAVNGGSSPVAVLGFSLWWLLLLLFSGAWASGVVACGLSSFSSRALALRLNSCGAPA